MSLPQTYPTILAADIPNSIYLLARTPEVLQPQPARQRTTATSPRPAGMPCPRPARCRQAPGSASPVRARGDLGRPSPGARILPPGSPPPLAGQGAPGLPLGRAARPRSGRAGRGLAAPLLPARTGPPRQLGRLGRALATRRRAARSAVPTAGRVVRLPPALHPHDCGKPLRPRGRPQRWRGSPGSRAGGQAGRVHRTAQGTARILPMRVPGTPASAKLTRERATARVHPCQRPPSARKMTYHRNSGSIAGEG